VSPESVDYLGTAERILREAQVLLRESHNELASREAYLAALNAARAVIFELTGDAPKTHSGTRALLSKLVHEGLPLDSECMRFLATGFDQKTDVDYGPRTPLSDEAAQSSLETAERFLLAARQVLRR
jgi:uncharacterized protein (UPF0332 family)